MVKNHPFSCKGKLHPAYKNGSGRGHSAKISSKFLQEHPYCSKCGIVGNLHVHHIDENPRNNSINNLRVLCSKCHGEIHRKYKTQESLEIEKEKQRERYRLKCIARRKALIESECLSLLGTTEVLTTIDICKKLGVSRQRVNNMRHANRIKFIQIGGIFFYPHQEIFQGRKTGGAYITV